MTSRERLLAALNHEPTDRVPVLAYELIGWNPAAWENNEPSYRTLMDAVREYGDCLYMSNPDSVAPPDGVTETTARAEGPSVFTDEVRHTALGDLTARYREDEGIHTRWTLEHPLKSLEDIGKYLSIPWQPAAAEWSRFDRERAELGDRGIMMISLADPICQAAELFEMGTFLTLALEETDAMLRFLDALHERQMLELRDILRHDVRDILFRVCGPEYATPPYLPPRLFPDFVTRYLIDISRAIREADGIVRIHSHGKVARALEEFARTDAQAVDPLEPPPDGDIALSEVKRRYGDRFCLFGNIELKELEHSSRERVDLLVRQAMDAAKPGGGFVLMPTAAPINVPLSKKTEENYLQYFESAMRYGTY